MELALNGNEHIATEVLFRHIPGLIAKFTEAADAEALALANGMVHQALMAADLPAIRCFDIAGLGGQVLFQEVPEFALTDKTDACGVFLVVGHETLLPGNPAHFRFLEFAHGEQGPCDAVA